MSDDTWFARSATLAETAQFPAIAARLVRLDADGAIALWEAWQRYVAEAPGRTHGERAEAFATHLRRGVERAVCGRYRHVAWIAAGGREPARIPASAWELLADDAPLTDAALRAWAGRPGMPLVVERVRAGGAMLPDDARGPFVLGVARDG